jgi:hypothetical protein
MVLSSDPEAKACPLGEKATLNTGLVCPSRTHKSASSIPPAFATIPIFVLPSLGFLPTCKPSPTPCQTRPLRVLVLGWPARDLIQPYRSIAQPQSQHVAIWRKRHAAYRTVCLQDMQKIKPLAHYLPYLHRSIWRPEGQAPIDRRKGHFRYWNAILLQSTQESTVYNPPQPHSSVPSPRGQDLTIGREGYAKHRRRIHLQDAQRLIIRGRPQPYGAVP